MKALILNRLKPRVRGPVSLKGVVPQALQSLSVAQISDLPVAVGESTQPLGSLFEIQDAGRDKLVFRGDLSNCSHVGGGMQSGLLEVEGSVGDFLAAGMAGGDLRVNGNAGRFAFSQLLGGSVAVAGNVGEYAAGVAPGQTTGMRGGQAIVGGSADRWLATRMRRGTVVVHGSVAAGAASRMIAGTLLVCGHCAQPLGAGMRRGTIILAESLTGEAQLAEMPGFTSPEPTELAFLPLLLRSLQPVLPQQIARAALRAEPRRAIGDRANEGLGEIFWLVAGQPDAVELTRA